MTMLKTKNVITALIGLLIVGGGLVLLALNGAYIDANFVVAFILLVQSAILLGVVYVSSRRSALTTKRLIHLESSVEELSGNMKRSLDQLGLSVMRKIDSLDRASQARYQRVDKRLGRQGRRIEATYSGIQQYLIPADPTDGGDPVVTQIHATNELLGRTNSNILLLRQEVDRGSRRLREHSGHLRRLLEEQSRISSSDVLLAKAAVIEELLEGMDSIICHIQKDEV